MADMAVVLASPDLGGMLADFGSPDLDICEPTHPVTPVNVPAGSMPDGGFPTLCVKGSPCSDFCPTGYVQCCHPTPSDGGAFQVLCVYNCGPAGRRPAGLEEAQASAGCAVGQYFAAMAHLEAASVHAFRAMARELAAHGAPARLVLAARRAARDEIRHARITRRLAREHGSTPPAVTVNSPEARSLEQIAVENAIEGCVRETFGALLASWQARAAGDLQIRQTMSAIADDEAEHAQLAWDVDAWAQSRLEEGARRRVAEARQAAVAALGAELDAAPPAELIERVGLPSAARARQFLDAAKQELWS
jgi:hypothetical protein